MKNLKCLFVILVFSNSLIAQNSLVLEPNVFDTTLTNFDISDFFLHIRLDSYMSNSSQDDTVEVVWSRVVAPDCQPEWGFITVDKYLDYPPSEDSCLQAFPLFPNEADVDFDLILRPNSTPGCCQLKVYFYSTSQPDVPIDSIQYTISINDLNCLNSTSLNNLAQKNSLFQIVPNPIQESFSINTDLDYDLINIQNSVGQVVKTLNVSHNEEVKISNLSQGVYFVNFYSDNIRIGYSKILKQ